MITLDKIITTNLEVLKNQESELLKALSFIKKAKQLFESQSETPGKKRKYQIATSPPKTTKRKRTRKLSSSKKTGGKTKVTRFEQIQSVLRGKKQPIATSELVQTLFKNQKKDKSLAHFRQLIYTTLTQAYKSGKVAKNKDGKIHLPV